MNSLKVVFGGSVNGIAAAYFIWARMVYCRMFVIMAVAAVVGGYGGAGVARKIGRTAVRRIVIANRIRHGGVAVYQESSLMARIRFAIRSLAKAPLLSLVVVSFVGPGPLGANTGDFSPDAPDDLELSAGGEAGRTGAGDIARRVQRRT